MVDYQKMYYLICSGASKAIDAPPQEAKQLLQIALYEAENIPVSAWKMKYRKKLNSVYIFTEHLI